MESKTVLQQPKTLFLPNKNSLDLSEENLEAQYGDNSLVVMKNDFYNDDFYDYKDTFLGRLDNNKDTKQKVNTNNHVAKIETGEDYDDDLDDGATDDDDDVDYDNDFTTGPLAIKKSSPEFSDNNMNFEQCKENEDYKKMGMGEEYLGDDYEDQDLMMSETFFKRVDSLELCKPKKAKIINNYLIGEILGDGSYGKVKECIDLDSLSRRAVKIINLKTVARKIPRGVENVRKEISIMKRLHHKNLIKLYDTFEKVGQTLQNDQNEGTADNEAANENKNMDELLAITSTMVNIEKPPKIYIFMDYCMTSLEKLLKTAPDQRLRNWQANHYFKQIIEGLEYLHSLNIIHNDIKPGNLLITCDNTVKICDFSISAELKIFYEHEYLKEKYNEENNLNNNNENDYDSETEINPQLIPSSRNGGGGGGNRSRFPIIQCTPIFQCPEMLDEDVDELMILKNAPKIDIWSTGITLFQLTTGQLPFPSQGQTIHQIFENIRSNTYEIKIPLFIDKYLRELLTNMLNRDPIKRWSIKQIRDSDWFRKKHSLVPEDVANLPEDVVHNEYATFRMMNYLEKLCQLKTGGELTSNDFSQFYDDLANQPHIDQFNNMNLNTDNNVNNSNHPNGAPQSPNHQNLSPRTNPQRQQPQTKSYSQATKVKKTHCSLM